MLVFLWILVISLASLALSSSFAKVSAKGPLMAKFVTLSTRLENSVSPVAMTILWDKKIAAALSPVMAPGVAVLRSPNSKLISA